MLHREEIDQYLLDMIISSGIRVFHPDELKIMLRADGLFLSVPIPHHFILKMLFSIEFNRQNRELLLSLFLIHHKVKTAVIKEVIVTFVSRKNV